MSDEGWVDKKARIMILDLRQRFSSGHRDAIISTNNQPFKITNILGLLNLSPKSFNSSNGIDPHPLLKVVDFIPILVRFVVFLKEKTLHSFHKQSLYNVYTTEKIDRDSKWYLHQYIR